MARLTLQARHSRSCSLYPSTSFKLATRKDGCTCSPSYALRGWHEGRLTWEKAGQNRKEAERLLDARRGDVARQEYKLLEGITFSAWANQWLASATIKPNSKRVYRTTLDYAEQAFGRKKVRDLSPDDVGRFLDLIRRTHLERQHPKPGEQPKPIADGTLAKHLRQVAVCLQAAIPTYANSNPVRLMHGSVKPRPAKSKPTYFTDPELRRLWSALAAIDRPWALAVCQVAATTGLRIGELSALTWQDVDFLRRELHVRRTYIQGIGLGSPKSGESRVVDLVPAAQSVLERWFAESGGGEGSVFTREDTSPLTPDYIADVLYESMATAGVDRVGDGGRARTFHSFRHSYARASLEAGAPLVWVQRQLGHASISTTMIYAAWAREAEKEQAVRLVDAFAV